MYNNLNEQEKSNTKKYRHELKFVCDERQLILLEDRIRHICTLDSHVDDSGKYLVRSLYFDTYDDCCLYENETGVDQRKKYRMRLYNGNADLIYLECKEALHGLRSKDICSLTKQQCRQLMYDQPVTEVLPQQELLRNFLLHRSMELFRPKVIVEYTRTPYVHEAGNVRITFDRCIRSSSSINRFMEKKIPGRSIMEQGSHILEVKYDEGLPGAIEEMLSSGQRLLRSSFSKYSLCRQYGMR